MSAQTRKRLLIFLAAVLVSVFHLQVFSSSWGDRIEPLVLDLWFNLRGPIEPPENVVVAAMDEASYRVLDIPMDQAWPRALHAELLRKFREFGVKRVAMDILFLGDSSNQDADSSLAEAMKLNPTIIAAESARREVTSSSGSFLMEELLIPPERFSESAEGIALARLPEDQGKVRRFHVERTNTTRSIPALFQAAAAADSASLPGPRDFIWYYGPPGTITTFPIHQILNTKGALPESALKDKIVFVGLSLRTELGPAQKDAYQTPFYNKGSMFGVEIQATAAANLLNSRWIKRAGVWREIAILSLTSFILIFLICSLKPHWAALVIICSTAAWAISSYLFFLSGFFVPGLLLFAGFLPLTFLASTLFYYFYTFKSQQQVEKAFQMYVSPEMARQMRSNPTSLSLGGESLYATALFSDIQGFTTITESMTASEVSAMLNAYFTEVMNIVIENQGTLIKFIGDSAFALWGAPIKHSDHARLACETALGIQKEVAKFNASGRFPALNTRIGINTGTMVVGNLGSKRRFDYTAIGDSVNLASRLESINRYFGTSILVSESTQKEAGNKVSMFPLGSIVVSGKTEAVEVFALFENQISQEIRQIWLKALNKFRLRAWQECSLLFTEIKEKEPQLQKAAELYLNEVSRHKLTEPDDSWIGEINFSSK